DELGATKARIVVTSDLDEYSIAALAAAPVDGYGVGTSLVTGSGAPTAPPGSQLVAPADTPGSAGTPAPMAAAPGGDAGTRRRAGRGQAELIPLAPPGQGPNDRILLPPLVRDGEIIGRQSLQAARERHRAALAELPGHALQLSRGYPAIATVFEPDGD